MASKKREVSNGEDNDISVEGLPVLPSVAEKVDRELVDRAATHIRDVLAKTVTRGTEEVGRYLLRTFYENDPQLYFSFNPNKHASLRLLLERCESLELPVRRTFLSDALRIAAATKELPEDAPLLQLPPSHRLELLRLKEPQNVERLAARAVSAKLSIRKLRTLIQKEWERLSPQSGGGLKRKPVVLQLVRSCLRILRSEETGRLLVTRRDVSSLTEEQLAQARTEVASLEKRIVELRRLLG